MPYTSNGGASWADSKSEWRWETPCARRSKQRKKAAFASAVAIVLTTLAFSAHALTASVTADTFSNVVGASTVDFGIGAVSNTGALADGLPAGTLGGVQFNYSGGALFNFESSSNLPNGTSARPPGSTDNFWSIGVSPTAQNGPGVASFASGLSYFGFLWGSPDAYNTVSFYDGSTLLGSFNGSAILAPPDGDQRYSRYFNVFAGQNEAITSVKFESTSNAFETDNHAFVAAIPEPEIYAMMLAGLGLMGFVAGRRRA
jgi:hypothetical protein